MVTSAIAALFGMGVAFGVEVVGGIICWGGILGLFGAVGYSAHQNNKALYFYLCILSMVLIPFALPSPHNHSTDAQVIFNALVIGVGSWMTFVSIRFGHRGTRILGSLVMVPYVVSILGIILVKFFQRF